MSAKLVLIPFLAVLAMTIFYEGISTWRHYSDRSRHLAFLKIHKTGSSTVQNIFLRFADRQNLILILGSVTENDCGGAEHCISETNSLSDTNIVPPPKNMQYESLLSHVVYNKQQFRKYLPKDTRLISLVRDPIQRLQSAISHFNLHQNVNFSTYANDPFLYDHFRLNNGMAFDFGFPRHLFQNETFRNLDSKGYSEALAYVQELIEDISVIMINERLDESLILLKRILNWKTQDILYVNQRVRADKYRTFSKEEAEKLKQYLILDYLLYEKAYVKFNDMVEAEDDTFRKEVAYFKQVNNKVVQYCTSLSTYLPKQPLVIKTSQWHSGFNVTNRLCATMKRQEEHYLDIIRVKQYGTMDTS